MNVKNDTHSGQNSRHSITMVLSTVATCSITLNSNDDSGSRFTPSTCLKISRCPLLEMGRYSDSPCIIPRSNASNQSIVSLFYGV